MVRGVIGGRSESRPRVPGVSCKVELVGLVKFTKVGLTILPPWKHDKISVQGTAEVNAARNAVLNAQPETVSTTQATLCDMFDETQEKWFHNIIGGFDKGESISTL